MTDGFSDDIRAPPDMLHEMDWMALRDEMPVTRRWAYFDHAAVAPMSAAAQRMMTEWATDAAENGEVNEPRWMHRVEEVRKNFGHLLNADPLDIAFIKNTSEGIDFVAEGFPWRPGDNLITAAEEYPSNVYPWLNLADRGVEVRLVPSRGPRIAIEDIRGRMDNRTRLVSLSFVEFASGYRNDLDSVGALCRERGVQFFVDAIQGLSVLPLDVRRTPVDFLAADGHKWLLGPQGAGIFYVRREMLNVLHPMSVGWNSIINCHDFSRIDFRLKPHAGRWENGTLNMPGILGLGASLQLLLVAGLPAVTERLLDVTDYLCERAQRIGIEVFSSRSDTAKSGIVSLIVPGRDLQQLKRRCRDAGVIINHRAGRIRVSPHCYNTHEEIDRLIELLSAS
jgi:selenocysteine lyase/cysteine desulfurase